MLIKNLKLVLLSFLCLISFSCVQGIEEIGRIAFDLPQNKNANSNEINYTVILQNLNGAEFFNKSNLTEKVEITAVPIGNYLLKVSGENDKFSYYGEEKVIVESGKTSKVRIVLTPTKKVTGDFDITYKAVENGLGVEITLPSNTPAGATRFSIGRKNVNDSEDKNNRNEDYWYIYSSNPNVKVITDYFVEPGETYEYVVYYRYDPKGNNGKILSSSYPLEVKVPAGCGKGELKIPDSSTVNYDADTCMIKFNQKINLNEKISGLTGVHGDIRLWYGLQNNEGGWINSSMNENNEFKWDYSSIGDNYLGVPLYPKQLELKVYKDDINYSKTYNSESLSKIITNLPSPITLKDQRGSLTLDPAGQKGIKILIPEEVIKSEGVIEGFINKRKVGSINWDCIVLSPDIIKGKTEVIDYFVDPNTKYEYSARFNKYTDSGNDRKSETLFQSKTCEITSKDGYGELGLSGIKGEINNEIMTFSNIDTDAQIKDIPGTRKFTGIEVAYTISDNIWVWGGVGNNNKINWISSIAARDDCDNIFGKDLTADRVRIHANIDDVYYDKTIDAKEFGKYNISIPAVINIKDTRNYLTLDSSSQKGIKITLPTEVTNLGAGINCRIQKRVAGSNDNWEQINLSSDNITGKTEIIDYFVNPNTKYEYCAFFDKTSNNGNWEHILETKKTEVLSEDGFGELSLYGVKGEVNGGIMSFPALKDILKNIPGEKKFYDIGINYSKSGGNNNQIYASSNNSNIIDLNKAIEERQDCDEFFGKDLTPRSINISVNIDDVFYNKYADYREFGKYNISLPIVNIKDTRPELITKFTDKGIEITLPSEWTTNPLAYLCTISRTNLKTNEFQENYIEFNKTLHGSTSVIDYFVNSGTSYKYNLKIRDDSWNVLLNTKNSTVENSTGGVNELEVKDDITTTYDSSSGVMTINPVQAFTEQNNNLAAKIGKTVLPENKIKIGFNYVALPMKNGHTAYDSDHDGKINWSNELYENYNENLELAWVMVNSNIDGVKYERIYRDGELPAGVTKIINVPNKKSQP